MELRLTDREAVAVMHALEHFLKSLEEGVQEKGIKFEEDSLRSVLEKMRSLSGASGT